MARITVEDCILKVPNRFELVMLAAQRARDISAGAALSVDRDNDKNPVVALREIAEGTVDLDHLRYELIHGLRRHVELEDRPDDETSMSLGSALREEVGDALMPIGGGAATAAASLDDPIPDAMHLDAGAEDEEEDEEDEDLEAAPEDLGDEE